jgi:GMP synthase-like glutamine amidotransferase
MTTLLRQARARRVPVIGHCLGGQLFAKALGARVGPARTAEIGWVEVEACDAQAARQWFGGRARFELFEWHYEAFDLPPGAARVLANRFNDNQAYVVDDLHIGFQGHIELTPAIARHWVETGASELPERSTPAIQSGADILRDLDARIAVQGAVADAVYSRWARGLRD